MAFFERFQTLGRGISLRSHHSKRATYFVEISVQNSAHGRVFEAFITEEHDWCSELELLEYASSLPHVLILFREIGMNTQRTS